MYLPSLAGSQTSLFHHGLARLVVDQSDEMTLVGMPRSPPASSRRSRSALFIPLLLAPVLFVGCSSNGGGKTVGEAAPQSGADTSGSGANSQADPGKTVITLASTLTFVDDPATASSAFIAAATGGSLTVTASDGTTFTLDVPADSLAADTTITATATATASGVDPSTSMHAVHFQPEGLQFFAGALLHITPAETGVEGRQLPFQAAGDGTDLRLAMLEQLPSGTSIVVSHFSTYGIAIIDQLVFEITVRQPTAAAEAGLWNQISVAISIRNEILRLGQSSADMDLVLQNLFDEYISKVVTPLIEGSDGSCAASLEVAQATRHYYEIWLHNSLPNGIASLKTVAQSAFATMETTCEKDRVTECTAGPDRTILVNFWREMRKWRAALGLGQKPGDSPADEVRRASNICDSYAYTFTGGLEDFQVVDGLVCDVRKLFVLTAPGIGQAQFTGSLPLFDAAGLGTTIEGPYSAQGVFNFSYSGSYIITLPDGPGQAGTMESFSGGQIADASGSGTEKYTLTPAKDQCG